MNDDFQRWFSRAPEVAARAPGRVNLIGEHTDYNGGYVLPIALPHQTVVRLALRPDRTVRAVSRDLGAASMIEFELGGERRIHSWIDYIQGVTWALQERGLGVNGFDLLVASTVPLGKGLSSSASLEIAVARALNDAFDLGLGDVDLALIGHRAETGFVGAPVGIMDQMVCSLGDQSHALFLDAATRQFERILLPPDVELAVIDSGIAHSHASGDYRTRRAECESAAARLGVSWLRDVSIGDLDRVAALPDPLNRRARHVVTENARVLAAVSALKAGDSQKLGTLFLQSHVSMRDDFEVSLPEIDRPVAIAADFPETLGARLTGGGFGGAVVLLCRRGSAGKVAHRTVEAYGGVNRRDIHVLLPQAQ